MYENNDDSPEVFTDDINIANNVVVEEDIADDITPSALVNNEPSLHSIELKRDVALANLNKCLVAMDLEVLISEKLYKTCFKQSNHLINAEDACLTMAASGSYDDVFYCCVLSIMMGQREVTVCRVFESGEFRGFFYEEGKRFLQEQLSISEILPYFVYTHSDVKTEKHLSEQRYTGLRNPNKPVEKRRNVTSRNLIQNKKSFYNTLSNINVSVSDYSIKCLFSFGCCMHNLQRFDTPERPVENSNENIGSSLESLLQHHRSSKGADSRTELQKWLLHTFPENVTLVDQFYIISSIPNHHRWVWTEHGKQIRFEQKFSSCSKYYPGSPRNRIIQAWCYRKESQDIINACIKNVLGHKCEVPYPKRKRSISARAYPQMVQLRRKRPQPTLTEAFENQSQLKSTLFVYFTGELFRYSKLHWRHKDSNKQVVAMAAYNSETGDFMLLRLGEPMVSCECKIFSTLQPTTFPDHVNYIGSTPIPTCCHCRLMKDLLKICPFEDMIDLSNTPDYINVQVVLKAIEDQNTKVLTLESKFGIKRFSISGAAVEFVTIAKIENTSKEVAKCHSSICRMTRNQNTTRDIKNLRDKENLCEHLAHLCDFLYDESIEENPEDIDDMNTPDVSDNDDDSDDGDSTLPKNKWEDVFDVHSGKWKFGKSCPSTQKVDSDPFSEQLTASLKLRCLINIHNEETFPSFKPTTDGTCNCQAGWISSEKPNGVLKEAGTSTLYTDRGAITVKIFKRHCVNEKCTKTWTGENDCIFRLSEQTCAGYEIGWAFVENVNTGKQTFSGFTQCMNDKYKRYNPSGRPFMSSRTFISWWFAWASHMEIEFRQGCSLCNGHYKALACDGTKIGINFKQAFVKPIETPASEEKMKTTLRRMDRCFIQTPDKDSAGKFKFMRIDLKSICDKIINHEQSGLVNLNEYTECFHESCEPFITRILCDQPDIHLDDKERLAASKFLSICFTTCAINDFIPYLLAEKIKSFLATEISPPTLNTFVELLRNHCPELSNLLLTSFTKHNSIIPLDVKNFLNHICDRVYDINSQNVPPAAPQQITGTYNPARFGRAYYFSNHGEQIRPVRKFTIDKDDKKTNTFDDYPDQPCNKMYPDVSKKGTTYLFLWFCPYHGHCLGYHMITGSEGRKDAHSSLYTHLEEPPENIFYDFGCSLSEYCKNRESGYFHYCRFFHDIFHGYSHKCASCYKSNRLQGLSAVNSSICEQFNSFLQRIKASSKLMKQTHFSFYVQFFIHQWNVMMKKNTEKRINIAHKGTH